MRARRTIPIVAAVLAALVVACVPPTPPSPEDPATTAGTPAPPDPTLPAETTVPETTTTAPATTAATTTTTIPDPSRHGATPTPGFWRVQMPSTPDTRAVYAAVVSGGILYLGGEFTTLVSPDGSQSTTVANLAAIRMSDGTPVAGMPQVDGRVEALAVGGGRLYLGGQFNSVGGQSRNNLAAIELGSNTVSAGSLTPNAGGKVWALEASGSHVFVGGDFLTIGGLSQPLLASFSISSGAVDMAFNPVISGGRVRGLDLAPGGARLYATGQFTAVDNDPTRPFLASLDPATGDWSGPATWANVIKHLGEPSPGLQDVAVSADGSRIFAGAMGGWNSAVAWYATGTNAGKMIWQCRTMGNVQAIGVSNGDVYLGFHDGYQYYDGPAHTDRLTGIDPDQIYDGKIKVLRIPVNATLNQANSRCQPIEATATPAVDPVTLVPITLYVPLWKPSIDNQVWTITADGDNLIVTGDFSKVWEGDTQTRDAQKYSGFVVFD